MIIATKDKTYIKSCVKNGGEYGLSNDEIIALIIEVQDKTYIEECFLDGVFGEFSFNGKKVKLPNGMKFGIEIESEGDFSKIIRDYLSYKIADGWVCKEDGSLYNGVEVVSPPMESAQSATRDIIKVCTILKACGQTASKNCGGHIHIDKNYLTSIEAYKNLSNIWINSEKIIYIISNEKGSIIRTGFDEYASPISKKVEDAINSGEIDLQGEEDVQNFVEALQKIQRR